MRTQILLLILIPILCGCASIPSMPDAVPDAVQTGMSGQLATDDTTDDGPYRLWGEWTFYFDENHENVTAVPRRQARFHLNSLKFLESYCTDCIEVVNLKNNGDSTVDLTVKIKHPFEGHPEYTGFDVKGIIMFDGSWTTEGYEGYAPYPEPFRVSWRNLGDPQVLNADGYTLRWSPSYDSGSTMPIFNYYAGKYTNGTPTANINAYLNFYNIEDRHIFSTNSTISRTYHIWLPYGEEIVAGYAVEACWEPPLVTPVTNPADDFPITANQPEPYKFYYNINNDEIITDPSCCGLDEDPSEGFMYSKQWGEHTAKGFAIHSDYYHNNGSIWPLCGDDWPDWYCNDNFNAGNFPDGEYIGVVVNYGNDGFPVVLYNAYSVFEFTIDLQ